jgi:hypothetical protein
MKRLSPALIVVAVVALFVSGASASQPVKSHRFHGVRQGENVIFRINGLSGCSVTGGGVTAGSRFTRMSAAALERAIRHRVLRVRMSGRAASLNISCTNEAYAVIAGGRHPTEPVWHPPTSNPSPPTTTTTTTTTTSPTPTPTPRPSNPPSNTVAPTVSGTAQQGDALSASQGSWSGNPTSYSYQWQDCDASGSGCTSISTATSSTYTAQPQDVGDTLRVVVTARNAAGSASASSAATAAVQSGGGGGTSASIASAPDGPSAPAGGWSVEYGDAFNEPLCGSQGTSASSGGCDNTLFPNGRSNGCGDVQASNSDEMEEYNCSQVSVDSSGLDLTCNPASGLSTPSGYATSRYLCGAVTGTGSSPSGYKFFNWVPGQGQEWAVQITAEFPQNTGEADPGWWSMDPKWSEEIDFFEGFGWSAGKGGSWMTPGAGANPGGIGMTDATWIYNTNSDSAISTYNNFAGDLGFDPSAGFHTYTTVFYPNNTFSEYIDGRNVAWDYVSPGGAAYKQGSTLAGPPTSLSNATMGLLLSYGLRDDTDGDPDPYFTSGSRDFRIRSIGVYEDTAANGANTSNTGLAPGTDLSGS